MLDEEPRGNPRLGGQKWECRKYYSHEGDKMAKDQVVCWTTSLLFSKFKLFCSTCTSISSEMCVLVSHFPNIGIPGSISGGLSSMTIVPFKGITSLHKFPNSSTDKMVFHPLAKGDLSLSIQGQGILWVSAVLQTQACFSLLSTHWIFLVLLQLSLNILDNFSGNVTINH